MSNNAFRVKNSLHLTPQAVEPSGLEVGDLWMDIDGNLKRWDGSASQDVGSGGVGSVDIMFAQTLEQAVIGDFTTTGTVAIVEIATNPLDILQGKKTLKITHTGGASAEQIVEVPAKFRNKNVTLSLDVNSDATSGNLSLTVTDQTNTVTLINAESIQPQEAGQTSVKRSVSFNVPSDCEELKYKFTAVSESGAISLIDNVVIELTQTAKLDTTIEVPVITEWVDAGPITIGATTTAPTKGTTSVDSVAWRQVGESYELEYKYRQTTTSASGGSGTYIISLPAGLEFDSSVRLYTGADFMNLLSDGDRRGEGWISNNGADGFAVIVPYTSTSFRVITSNIYSDHNFWSSSYYSIVNPIHFTFNMKFKGKGLTATETQSVSLAQTVLVQESDSAFTGLGFVGNGSTNTGVIRLSGSVSNYGDALTYTSDAVLGDSWTVNKAGIYDVHASVDTSGGAGYAYYFTKNAIVLTATAASTHSITSRLSNTGYSNINNDVTQISGSDYLEVGDVIRFHCASSGVTASNGQYDVIKISYQGKLKQLNVSENQKIEIPTSELRMEGASARGTGAETFTAKYTNIAKIRGDAFSLDNSNATIVTMKKKGRLNVSASIRTNTSAASITKNQAVNTAAPLASERMAAALVSTATAGIMSMHACFDVNIGDVIRVNAEATPTADSGNSLTLSFQEQEVSVSVTNVLPQFSESDSSVRVDTANGYGSTNTYVRKFSNALDNIGTAISRNDGTLGDSLVSGDYYIIKENGIYHITYSDSTTASVDSARIAITKNSSQLNTFPTANILAISDDRVNTAAALNRRITTSWSGYLQLGDVIRAQADAPAVNGGESFESFTISKVGKPNVTGVDVTPFAKIEYEVKDEVQANTYAGYGSTNTRIPYYANITKNTNRGLIRVENSATLGFSITVLKACELTIESTHVVATGIAHGLTLNSAQLTTSVASINPPERLTMVNTAVVDNNQTAVASYTGFFQAGDVIRPHTTGGVPTTINRVNISITATELRDAYQVIGGGVENTYSARIQNNGAASVLSQSYPFIQSVSRTSTGRVTINFISGFFTERPTAIAIAERTDANLFSMDIVLDTSLPYNANTVSFVTRRPSDENIQDHNFDIILQRQGSDYRTPSKAIGLPAQRVAVLKDVKANNTAGGSASTTYTARVLNTLQDPTGMVVNASSFTGTGGTNSSIILGAGTYRLTAKAPATGTSDAGTNLGGRSRIRLYNVTDASTVATGQLVQSAGGQSGNIAGMVSADLECYFTLTAQKTLEIQHRFVTTTASSLGFAANFSEDEQYTTVYIEKIEE